MRWLFSFLLILIFPGWNGLARNPAEGTIDNLIFLVRSQLQAKTTDEKISRDIEKIYLEERLDDEVIEYLENEGIGRLTIDALERQHDASYRLSPPAKPLNLFEPHE